jgi:hypothetical protein
MIKQVIDVNGYWKVIVFYDIDYNLSAVILKEFDKVGISRENLDALWGTMLSWRAKGVTYSDLKKHTSIILFNKHCARRDYLNTLVHEAEHVKQAMLRAYEVEDKDEPPAYTIGYLVMKMWEVWKDKD